LITTPEKNKDKVLGKNTLSQINGPEYKKQNKKQNKNTQMTDRA